MLNVIRKLRLVVFRAVNGIFIGLCEMFDLILFVAAARRGSLGICCRLDVVVAHVGPERTIPELSIGEQHGCTFEISNSCLQDVQVVFAAVEQIFERVDIRPSLVNIADDTLV